MSENASRDALSGRIGLFGRAIRPARSTTRGSEAEIAWKVAFGCFSLTGGKPNGECRLKSHPILFGRFFVKAFPHQFNQLDKLTEALELLNIMKADNRNVVDDKELGSELARYGIYNFRNLVTSVEDRLKVEMQKAPGDQGFRTAARDIRRFFKLSGLVTSTWNLAPRGREILDAKGRKYLRDALWRQAMIDLRLPDSDGNISHPYRFLLKLVGDYPGIQTKKLLLAFEAHDDSPEEYARISSMVPLSFEDIVAKMDVTKSSAANAIKILPAIAEQVGDIERSRHCFPNVMGLPSEDGDYEYLEGSSAPAPAKTPMEVDPEDISKVPDFGELNPNGSFDLSAANEIRKKRTIQHHKAVASIAKLIAEEGFKVFEYVAGKRILCQNLLGLCRLKPRPHVCHARRQPDPCVAWHGDHEERRANISASKPPSAIIR